MHAYTSSLRPNPADADDTYVASGYRTPSRFGFPPPNAGMVITFWVPSFTGSSNWPALRSAPPSSQPTLSVPAGEQAYASQRGTARYQRSPQSEGEAEPCGQQH